jgi:hypothetical protein
MDIMKPQHYFWVDATVRIREIKTVTQEKAYWMLPTGIKKIAYSQLLYF